MTQEGRRVNAKHGGLLSFGLHQSVRPMPKKAPKKVFQTGFILFQEPGLELSDRDLS